MYLIYIHTDIHTNIHTYITLLGCFVRFPLGLAPPLLFQCPYSLSLCLSTQHT